MLTDGINGWTYVYDAENRITTAGSVTYTYDADGRRMKKSSGTNYWYGPTGAVLAETDSSGNWTNYIFFGGQRLARNAGGTINYFVTDHLHSTAVYANSNGTVVDDNDFYPWGGVVPGVGQTTSNNSIKFTGQYRDTESNLDYFGARYYENATGRFMTADWDGKPNTVPYAEFGDPQSLNLYSYVRNSPIVRVDAGGHMVVGFTNDGVFGARSAGVDDGSGGLDNGGSNGYALNWTTVTVTHNGVTDIFEMPSGVARPLRTIPKSLIRSLKRKTPAFVCYIHQAQGSLITPLPCFGKWTGFSATARAEDAFRLLKTRISPFH
jgi:RHS repeat-associated protein